MGHNEEVLKDLSDALACLSRAKEKIDSNPPKKLSSLDYIIVKTKEAIERWNSKNQG